MRRGIARLTLGLGSAALLAAAAACSSGSSSPSTTPSSASGAAQGTASASALSGSCGTIPNVGYTDKSGLVAGLGSYAANYNGLNGTVYASPWKTWKGKASGVKIGILIDGLGNPYQTEIESALTANLKALGYSTTALAPSTASITNQLQAYQTL